MKEYKQEVHWSSRRKSCGTVVRMSWAIGNDSNTSRRKETYHDNLEMAENPVIHRNGVHYRKGSIRGTSRKYVDSLGCIGDERAGEVKMNRAA